MDLSKEDLTALENHVRHDEIPEFMALTDTWGVDGMRYALVAMTSAYIEWRDLAESNA